MGQASIKTEKTGIMYIISVVKTSKEGREEIMC
jgi:hypothetical protein